MGECTPPPRCHRDQPHTLGGFGGCGTSRQPSRCCAGVPRAQGRRGIKPQRCGRRPGAGALHGRGVSCAEERNPTNMSWMPGGMRPTLSTDGQPESARQEGAARGFTDGVCWAVVFACRSRQDRGACLHERHACYAAITRVTRSALTGSTCIATIAPPTMPERWLAAMMEEAPDAG
jgi:hypothetical protein